MRFPQRILPGYEGNSAEDSGRYSAFGSQSDWVPYVETPCWSIDRLPSRRPFSGVMIVGRGVESQPGNNCERMTFARVNSDPFAATALAVAAELG